MFRFPAISSHFKILAVAAMMLAPPVAAQHAHGGTVKILSLGGSKLVIHKRKQFVHRHHAAPVLKHKVKPAKRVLHPRRKLVLKHHRPRHLKHRSFGLRHKIHRKFR